MLQSIYARLRQGYRTIEYPAGKPPEMPERYTGLPKFHREHCLDTECRTCIDCCPVGAIEKEAATGTLSLDLGRCIFCRECVAVCPKNVISFTRIFSMAKPRRNSLILRSIESPAPENFTASRHQLFRHSLKLRQVCAGGCNACEADTNVLGTIGYDLGRFGIQFVASPRHADGLLVTGPLTENMKEALLKTYEAVPEPKIVIAVGACAISGGLFRENPETAGGLDDMLPVDCYIPGCPPHPLSILAGLLSIVGKI